MNLSSMRLVQAVMAALLVVGALVLSLAQVEVELADGSESRSCGSAFDAAADRSGWQQWWAQDLDEPTPTVAAELTRTRACPDAVNRRMVGSAVLVALAIVLLAGVWWSGRVARAQSTERARRIERIGTIAAGAGSALTAGGVLAIIALVADADATMFLYVDRIVVVLGGLIVLVPPIALALGGWALRSWARADEPSADHDG